MDFDFTLSLEALELSLTQNRSFLSHQNRCRGNKQNNDLEIDLNVHVNEYEPFTFHHLNMFLINVSPRVKGKFE
jgi:hypothetical protein